MIIIERPLDLRRSWFRSFKKSVEYLYIPISFGEKRLHNNLNCFLKHVEYCVQHSTLVAVTNGSREKNNQIMKYYSLLKCLRLSSLKSHTVLKSIQDFSTFPNNTFSVSNTWLLSLQGLYKAIKVYLYVLDMRFDFLLPYITFDLLAVWDFRE